MRPELPACCLLSKPGVLTNSALRSPRSHRNTDPEPFSGLCMHPIEHLYYYSNAWTPALYLTLSPFIFLYTFVHLTIAPGAGHSGWEDHFQSDQYHYLHHAKFEWCAVRPPV